MSLAAVFELDCKQVVGGISSKLNFNFKFEAIFDIFKASLSLLQNFKINFIWRQANNVVHLLTKALSYVVFKFKNCLPSCIENVTINKMTWFYFRR